MRCPQPREGAVGLPDTPRSVDFVDKQWLDSAERPFDPPLTATGVTQGTALGRRLRSFVPPITKCFVSPLVRTVQTADAAAAELGLSSLFIEPGLVEVLDTEWYECWRCKPSDARGDVAASTLFLSPAQLREAVTTRVDTSYKPVLDVSQLTVRPDAHAPAPAVAESLGRSVAPRPCSEGVSRRACDAPCALDR